jgi:hypothetical protein
MAPHQIGVMTAIWRSRIPLTEKVRDRPLPVGFLVEMAAVLSHVALHNGWSVLSDFA